MILALDLRRKSVNVTSNRNTFGCDDSPQNFAERTSNSRNFSKIKWRSCRKCWPSSERLIRWRIVLRSMSILFGWRKKSLIRRQLTRGEVGRVWAEEITIQKNNFSALCRQVFVKLNSVENMVSFYLNTSVIWSSNVNLTLILPSNVNITLLILRAGQLGALAKYTCRLEGNILRAGQLGALVKYTSRLEENKLVSNRTNLIRTSDKLGMGFTVVYNLNGGHYLNVRYSVPPVSQKRFQCEWKVKNVPLRTKLEIGKLKKKCGLTLKCH